MPSIIKTIKNERGTVKNKTRNAPKAANLRGCWAMLLTMAGTLKGLT
jgi:hypothetical protein